MSKLRLSLALALLIGAAACSTDPTSAPTEPSVRALAPTDSTPKSAPSGTTSDPTTSPENDPSSPPPLGGVYGSGSGG